MQAEHGELRVDRRNFDFARKTAFVHLTGAEFASAGRDYPIVFLMHDERPVPVALLGLRKGENLLVDHDGNWARDAYIPAYFRLYPFLLAEVADTRGLAVLIDEASPVLSRTKGLKIYDQGAHGPALAAAVALGREFHGDQLRSRVALDALGERGLFVRRDLSADIPGQKPAQLKDFWIVDRKALADLSDEMFVELRRKGAIELVYLHLASLGCLAKLGARLADGQRSKPKARAASPKLRVRSG